MGASRDILGRLKKPQTKKGAKTSSDVLCNVGQLPKSLRQSKQANTDSVDFLKYISGAPLRRASRYAGNLEYLHVSSLVSGCLRRYLLARKYDVPLREGVIWPSNELTYAQGNAIEKFIIRRTCMGAPTRVYGNFTCRCGSFKFFGKYSDTYNRFCKICRTTTYKYLGFTTTDDGYKLVGNIDLMLLIASKFLVVEIKSIASEHWDTIKDTGQAQVAHTLQGGLYWKMLHDKKVNLYKKFVILYVNKDFRAKSPYIPIYVNPESTVLTRQISTALDACEEYNSKSKSGKLLPRISKCTSRDSYTAKHCESCELCFDPVVAKLSD